MNRERKLVIATLVGSSAALSGCLPDDDLNPEALSGLTGTSLGMVVDNATGKATVFNADTNTVLGIVPGLGGLAPVSGDCTITADGRQAFFTHFNSSVTVADLTTTPPSLAGGSNPLGIDNPGEDTALSPDQRFLLVCGGNQPAAISVIDVATQAQVSSFNTGTDCNSIDVCSDRSVLVTSFTANQVRRLALSKSGILTDTGESLTGLGGPMNVYCAPAATSGVVVQLVNRSVLSFKIPGLTAVSTRNIGSNGLSGAINHAGSRLYVRTLTGLVSGFALDQATGVLGAAPLFQVSTAPAAGAFFGIDQLAVHPKDASLYVSQPGSLRILDAATGANRGSIVGSAMSQATGVCFGAVDPNHPPVARCADRITPADETCHGAASVDDGSFDPDGDPFSCTAVPSGPFGQGPAAVTLTCTDFHGASSSCDATVTVADLSPPSVSCPADQTVECDDGAHGATAIFSAQASDNCDPAPAVACAPPSGSTFPLGTTVDTCSASDNRGNTSRCTHSVTVVDTRPATVIAATPAPLWPPDHKYHRIDLSDCIASIADTCDGPLDIASHARFTCCASDEPDNGTGDGDTADDCVIVNSHSVDVRAERAGNGNGRVYTIHYTVTDDSNNATNHTCSVTVPHSQDGSPAIDDGEQPTCR